MTIRRELTRTDTPAAQPGFLGAGHMARAVIQNDFSESDPFIMLMDDMLDKQDDIPVGGPHPHAGFETVSLLIEGEMGDEVQQMKSGDFQIMTAGSGVIHAETIEKKARMRLLQLWLNLPKEQRWASPRVQDMALENVPTVSEEGLKIRVYSGVFAGLTSPVANYVPLIIADISMDGGVTTTQVIPASFSTFLYVLNGTVMVGDEGKPLHSNQVGWLNKFPGAGSSELVLKAGESGARLVLYSAEPQHHAIVSHGPFIGDTQQDIIRLYQEFRQGKMQDISSVEASRRIRL